jgi:phenylalanyl-tRNA synthetase alpha chain
VGSAESLATLVDQALADVDASTHIGELEEVRVRLLGKKGLLTEQLKGLGALVASDRPAAGQRINDAKAAIHAALEMHRLRLEQAAMEKELAKGTIDGTWGGRGQPASGDPDSLKN